MSALPPHRPRPWPPPLLRTRHPPLAPAGVPAWVEARMPTARSLGKVLGHRASSSLRASFGSGFGLASGMASALTSALGPALVRLRAPRRNSGGGLSGRLGCLMCQGWRAIQSRLGLGLGLASLGCLGWRAFDARCQPDVERLQAVVRVVVGLFLRVARRLLLQDAVVQGEGARVSQGLDQASGPWRS